jgi:hypothetical protein
VKISVFNEFMYLCYTTMRTASLLVHNSGKAWLCGCYKKFVRPDFAGEQFPKIHGLCICLVRFRNIKHILGRINDSETCFQHIKFTDTQNFVLLFLDMEKKNNNFWKKMFLWKLHPASAVVTTPLFSTRRRTCKLFVSTCKLFVGAGQGNCIGSR